MKEVADEFITSWNRAINAYVDACTSAFDALPERLLRASFRPFIRKCNQDDTYHWRWERCYCAPVFKPAPAYPRYLYEEIHGLTGYDELYPSDKPQCITGSLQDTFKALANMMRSSGVALSEPAGESKRTPEFFINH